VEHDETIGGNLDIAGNLTATSFYAKGNFYLDNQILIPAGTVIQSAAINVPGGWLDCNGQLLNKVAYADLFAAIGNTYGGLSTDASFNVPDARGRTAIGVGTGVSLTTRALGAKDGTETHTLTVGEMPAHSHSLTRRANSDTGTFDTDNGHQDESSAATTDRDDLGTFNTYNTGDNAPHNNMQPFITLRYLIKM
jgi:microcystin-dependent protein